jgi:hypothetical protein
MLSGQYQVPQAQRSAFCKRETAAFASGPRFHILQMRAHGSRKPFSAHEGNTSVLKNRLGPQPRCESILLFAQLITQKRREGHVTEHRIQQDTVHLASASFGGDHTNADALAERAGVPGMLHKVTCSEHD